MLLFPMMSQIRDADDPKNDLGEKYVVAKPILDKEKKNVEIWRNEMGLELSGSSLHLPGEARALLQC